MSLRNKATKKQLTQADIEALKELNQKKAQIQRSGLSPEHIAKVMAAEETVFAVKDTDRVKSGSRVSDNFKKISDVEPSKGIVIYNPVKERTECIIGPDNKLYNLDGSMHPATVRLMKRYGL